MIRRPREERRTFTGQDDVADTLNVLFTTAAGRGMSNAARRPAGYHRPADRKGGKR